MCVLKWLHLSDFHFGKDKYDEQNLCPKIVEKLSELDKEGKTPDVIFVTGDIAYSGLKSQYSNFDSLLLDICGILHDKICSRIYIVPGNHDVDRNQNPLIESSLYSYATDKRFGQLLDPTESGYKMREQVIARFSGFRETFRDSLCHSPEDIFSPAGYFVDSFQSGKQTVGIAGINTSWLAHGKEDNGNVTPGFRIVESAVNELSKYQYRIILGHHPVFWFQPKEKAKISALFAKNNIIYLCGHIHVKEAGNQMAASGRMYLHFGAGAAFLSRDEDKLRHSIQYGELHENGVKLFPFRWVEEQQGWAPDSPDFYPIDYHENDHWFFPFPSSLRPKPTKRPASLGGEWMILEKNFVEKKEATAPSEADMLMFFDGRGPEYSFAFSSQIPVRGKVDDYVNEFLLAERNGKCKCMLLTGAGGEGKSTLSFQIIKRLALQDWVIVHCTEPNKETTLTFSGFEKIEDPVLVVVDNASTIAHKLYQFLCDARNHGKLVHLLMISDWASWNRLKSKWDWEAVSDYSRNTVAGITLEEAEAIVTAWSKYGDQGLGMLAKFGDLDAAVKELYSMSQADAQADDESNSLLGAIIEARYRDEYLVHVRSIMIRLQHIPLGLSDTTDTLLDAFVRIALMHNEGKLILSSDILAELYHCSRQEVRRAILIPLLKEAVTRSSGEVICVRHHALAKCVISLIDEFDHIVWEDYVIEMVEAAMRLRTYNGEYVYEIESWRYLANHFLRKGMKPFAVRIAKAVYSIDHKNEQVLLHLVNVYLYDPDPDYMLANQVLWEYPYQTYDEKILYVFARVASHMGQLELSIYLNCVSISDQAECFTTFEPFSSQKIQKIAYDILNLPYCKTNDALSRMGCAFGTVAAAMETQAVAQTDAGLLPLDTAKRNDIELQLETGVEELLKILELNELPGIVPTDKKITFNQHLLSMIYPFC